MDQYHRHRIPLATTLLKHLPAFGFTALPEVFSPTPWSSNGPEWQAKWVEICEVEGQQKAKAMALQSWLILQLIFALRSEVCIGLLLPLMSQMPRENGKKGTSSHQSMSNLFPQNGPFFGCDIQVQMFHGTLFRLDLNTSLILQFEKIQIPK